HPLWTACVDHHRPVWAARGEAPFERCDDAAALAKAAVFSGQYQLDSEAAEEIEIHEIPGTSATVEKRRRNGTRAERFGQRRKGRKPDAPRHHPRLRRRIDDRKRPAERTKAADALSGARGIEQGGRDADALIE